MNSSRQLILWEQIRRVRPARHEFCCRMNFERASFFRACHADVSLLWIIFVLFSCSRTMSWSSLSPSSYQLTLAYTSMKVFVISYHEHCRFILLRCESLQHDRQGKTRAKRSNWSKSSPVVALSALLVLLSQFCTLNICLGHIKKTSFRWKPVQVEPPSTKTGHSLHAQVKCTSEMEEFCVIIPTMNASWTGCLSGNSSSGDSDDGPMTKWD